MNIKYRISPDTPAGPTDMGALRELVRRMERGDGTVPARGLVLGCPALDDALPEGGLALGRVHEVLGPARSDVRDAAAFGFTIALLALLMKARPQEGPVIWCPRSANLLGGTLYIRGLVGLGLDADRLILVETRDEAERVWALEEALSTKGVLAALAELDPVRADRRDDKTNRRLQLAAERSGVTGFLLRPRMTTASGAAARATTLVESRWQVSAAPSPLGPHDARPVWSVLLERAKRARRLASEPRRIAWDAPHMSFFEVFDRPATAAQDPLVPETRGDRRYGRVA
jgi:protein ImuA